MIICIVNLLSFPFEFFSQIYRVFIKYCVFVLKLCDFLNSAISAEALVFYLPGMCKHTDTEGKQRKSPEYFKIFKKKHNI